MLNNTEEKAEFVLKVIENLNNINSVETIKEALTYIGYEDVTNHLINKITPSIAVRRYGGLLAVRLSELSN